MTTTTEGRRLRRRAVPLLAVLGPGLLAGLSDDDPAGITTYSSLGADYGYRLLWVLLLATLALMVFHNLGARMGVVTGQGLIGLVRHRYGVRVGGRRPRDPGAGQPRHAPPPSSPASRPGPSCSA